jgi:hypothetical protein
MLKAGGQPHRGSYPPCAGLMAGSGITGILLTPAPDCLKISTGRRVSLA